MRQRRWMMFVDGENLAVQGQKLAQKSGNQLPASHHIVDSFLWPGRVGVDPRRSEDWGMLGLEDFAQRAYYYTSVQGSDEDLQRARNTIRAVGFEPVVFKKPKGSKSKGVDVTLTRDMLCHAFRDNYEVAMLVGGDADYCPLVEELKRLGRIVVIRFWEGQENGLSPELKGAADSFRPLIFA